MATPTVSIGDDASSRSISSSCVNCDAGRSTHSLIDADPATEQCEDPCPVSCTDTEKSNTRRSICFNPIGQCVWGFILIITAISGFIFPPKDVMLWEKLNMRPGFPPFDWWADPPDEVKMRAHIFNVTNHERFLQGLDDKMNVEEIGPITYLEKLVHSNIKFNENSTLTYTAKRFLIYLPDENTIDLNDTLIVPNLALLGMSSYLHNANYFLRTGFRILVNSHGTEYFVKKTIYEYLWDYTDALLNTSKSLVPDMVPVTNMGMLSRIYAEFEAELTVKIGPQWGHREFFKIDRVDGLEYLDGYNPEKCPDRLTGATEGVMYHQHMQKDDVLLGLRKTVCKALPLYFDDEATLDGIPVYRYNLSEDVFDRVENGTDCYASDSKPLPSGISDTSKCFYDFPMVASYPHFYTGQPPKDTYVTGLKPNRTKHNSFVYVEPLSGIPFRAVARMQCNLRINDLTPFYSADLDRFSNMILPIGWIEYNQEGLPTHILYTLYFMLIILPPLSITLFILALIFGCYLIAKQFYAHRLKREILPSIMRFKNHKVDNISQNKIFSYEKESFLKKPSKSLVL